MLRDDAGGEYISNVFEAWLASKGIVHQKTATASPQQDGMSERGHRTVENAVTCMLQESGLPANLWPEAVRCFEFVSNKMPCTGRTTTPYESFFGRKPSVARFRVFGSVAYVHVMKTKRKPFEPKMIKCYMIGYATNVKAWRLYDPIRRVIIESRDVLFDERPPVIARNHPIKLFGLTEEQPFQLQQVEPSVLEEEAQVPRPATPEIDPLPRSARTRQAPGENWRVQNAEQYRNPAPRSRQPTASAEPEPAQPQPVQNDQAVKPHTQLDLSDSESDQESANHVNALSLKRTFAQVVAGKPVAPGSCLPSMSSDNAEPMSDRPAGMSVRGMPLSPKTTSKHPSLDPVEITANAFAAVNGDPVTWKECMSRPDRQKWIDAAKERHDALLKQQVYELVDRPKDRKVLRNKPVFAIKPDRYQVRIAAKGFGQIYGQDFEETFSPVAASDSVRMLLSLAAILDLHVHQVDYSQAYLNAPLDKVVYMEQPEMWHDGTSKVCKLLKSIDGLKQSGRQWHLVLKDMLDKLGFKVVLSLPSCHVMRQDDIFFVLPIIVDDKLLICNNLATIQRVKAEFNKAFKCKDLGEVTSFGGIKIERNRKNKTMSLSSHDYVEKLLRRFNMQDSRPCKTPMPEGLQLEKDMPATTDQEREFVNDFPYLEIAGALNWLAGTTRPDLSYAVSIAMRYASCYGPAHCHQLLHVLKYLNGTRDIKLVLGIPAGPPLDADVNLNVQLQAFADASYGDCKDDGKSTSGFAMFLNGSLVHWGTKKQPVVAQSTMESEMVSANSAGRTLVHGRNVLWELGFGQKDPSKLWQDNQACIKVVKDPQHHGRAKHMDLRYFWIREAIQQKKIAVQYIATQDQIADIFTKPLGFIKHRHFSRLLGLRSDTVPRLQGSVE